MKKARLFAALLVLVLALSALTGCGSGGAGKFPEREITMINPFAPGGSSDIVGRAVSKFAEKHLGKPVVTVNKAGAAGTIGTSEFKSTRPDGYTVMWTAVGMFTTQPHLAKLSYTPDDFEVVIGVTVEPIFIAARAEAPWNNMKDLIDDFKKSGKELKFGSSGAGTLPHLGQFDIFAKAGIRAAHVPFAGAAPSLTALLGGNIDVATGHPAEVTPHVRAGKMKLLGIMSGQRAQEFPDVATMKEQLGYNVAWDVWKFIAVPKGTPAPVKQKLHDAFKKALEDPELQKMSKDGNFGALYISGEEAAKRVQDEFKVMGDVITAAGLKK